MHRNGKQNQQFNGDNLGRFHHSIGSDTYCQCDSVNLWPGSICILASLHSGCELHHDQSIDDRDAVAQDAGVWEETPPVYCQGWQTGQESRTINLQSFEGYACSIPGELSQSYSNGAMNCYVVKINAYVFGNFSDYEEAKLVYNGIDTEWPAYDGMKKSIEARIDGYDYLIKSCIIKVPDIESLNDEQRLLVKIKKLRAVQFDDHTILYIKPTASPELSEIVVGDIEFCKTL